MHMQPFALSKSKHTFSHFGKLCCSKTAYLGSFLWRHGEFYRSKSVVSQGNSHTLPRASQSIDVSQTIFSKKSDYEEAIFLSCYVLLKVSL